MINELEELFATCNYPFVTVIAKDKTLGNYCTESYQDMERLYNDMNRHDLTINDICLKEIEKNEMLDEKELSDKIEKLSKELDDAHSRYHSARVAKQAADYEHYQFVQKKEALEDFVAHFNGTHNDDEHMKLTKVNRTKVVLWYVSRHATRLKRFISFYDDLNLDGIRNDIALYHQLPDQFKECFFIEQGALEMTNLFYIITIKPHYKADSTPDFNHFDIIFQLDKNDDSITTTVTKENLFDAISKYVRHFERN